MTEFEAANQPRRDMWTVLGLGALADAEYRHLLAELQESYGLTVVVGPEESLGTETAIQEGTAAELGRVVLAAPESDYRPRALTFDDLVAYDASHPREDSTTLTCTALWTRLHRAELIIQGARQEQQDNERQGTPTTPLRRLQAGLPLAAFPSDMPGDPPGKRPIDLQSLEATLRMLLAQGYPAAGRIGVLRNFGVRTLDFFAGLVNVRFRPDTLLPRYEDVKAGLEPLPPMYPRSIHTDSPYVHEIMQGQRSVAVVSRDALHAFVVSIGVPANTTGHFLQFFEELAALQLGEKPVANQANPHWISEDVCYLRNHKVIGGSQDGRVWGIRFPAFIETIYELERDTELRQQVAGFGPHVRKYLRQYFDQVAPYMPPTE